MRGGCSPWTCRVLSMAHPAAPCESSRARYCEPSGPPAPALMVPAARALFYRFRVRISVESGFQSPRPAFVEANRIVSRTPVPNREGRSTAIGRARRLLRAALLSVANSPFTLFSDTISDHKSARVRHRIEWREVDLVQCPLIDIRARRVAGRFPGRCRRNASGRPATRIDWRAAGRICTAISDVRYGSSLMFSNQRPPLRASDGYSLTAHIEAGYDTPAPSSADGAADLAHQRPIPGSMPSPRPSEKYVEVAVADSLRRIRRVDRRDSKARDRVGIELDRVGKSCRWREGAPSHPASCA